jgi:Zn-dependent protease
MSGAWSIGRVFGIPVRVHWTLLVLGVLVGLTEGAGALGTILSATLLFASVVVHEVAHALVARAHGIATRDIVLTPIGGVARLEDMPRSGRAEVLIALAGPAASLLLSAAAFAALALTGKVVLGASLLSTLAWSNAMLGLFNLLPAFPMDGGRVLRGALNERIGLVRATNAAARIGRVAAVVLGLVGLFTTNVSLVLIAFFVWSASGRERAQVEAEAAWARLPRAWDAHGRPIEVELVPHPFDHVRRARPSRPVTLRWVVQR